MSETFQTLYPLQFAPLFRSYIWGGRGLQDYLGKAIPDEGVWAESWEIVDHGPDQSIITHGFLAGKSLGQAIAMYPHEILGEVVFQSQTASINRNRPPHFPLLLKYLDCHQVLSVQVHPDDAYGLKMPQPDLGKTEAWYVVDAKPEATIYAGLLPGVTRKDLAAAIAAGKTETCLHQIKPQRGDCVFIPAGTVHALGSGLMVAEIQQSSDTTFRLFDWNRVDAQGKGRPLHIEQALDVIDYDRGPVSPQTAQTLSSNDNSEPQHDSLVKCSKFQIERWSGCGSCQVNQPGRFTLFTLPAGQGVLNWANEKINLQAGDSLLIPALTPAVFWGSNDPAAVVLTARHGDDKTE